MTIGTVALPPKVVKLREQFSPIFRKAVQATSKLDGLVFPVATLTHTLLSDSNNNIVLREVFGTTSYDRVLRIVQNTSDAFNRQVESDLFAPDEDTIVEFFVSKLIPDEAFAHDDPA